MTTSVNLTGYGPRRTLLFDGDESKYELWEVKFLGSCTTWLSQRKVKRQPPTQKKGQVRSLNGSSVWTTELVIREENNDGRGARKVLREHY